MMKAAILAGVAFLALAPAANAQTATATGTNNVDVSAGAASGAAAVNDGNSQNVNFGDSVVPDGSRAVPDVVVPSVIGNGACSGAGFSAGVGVSGFGIGLGANTIDEDCTIREYVTLMYNMCASGNQTWCQVADRMLLNEVPMITQAWNDVVAPPPAAASPAAALPTAADAVPVAAVSAPVVPQVAVAAVNCPETAPRRDAGELTRLYRLGCRWN